MCAAVTKKVAVKSVQCSAPSPIGSMLATFVPESKGQPAIASILDYSGGEPVTVSRRSFFRATGRVGGLRGGGGSKAVGWGWLAEDAFLSNDRTGLDKNGEKDTELICSQGYLPCKECSRQ